MQQDDKEKTQSRLIEQARLSSLGQKVGSIFHDMCSPLISIEDSAYFIKMYTEDIIKALETNSKDKILASINQIVERCNRVDARVKFMKEMRNTVIAQSKQEEMCKWEKFAPQSVLEKVKFFAVEDIREHKCTLIVENTVDENVKIYGKEVSLIQVLNNLITNSAEAYGKNGKIEVTVVQKDDVIEFSVKDTAGGMPLEVQSKILLNEMVTTKGQDGNGIGVYSSYLIIKDYFKGTMWFESKEGGGTTFFIDIPIAVKTA